MTVTGGRGYHPKPTHPADDVKPLDRTFVHSLQVPETAVWQTKPILFKLLKDQIDEHLEKYGEENAPPPWQVYTIINKPGPGNLHMIQKVFEGNFEFDIIFNSGSSGKVYTSQDVTGFIEKSSKAFWKDSSPPLIFSPHLLSSHSRGSRVICSQISLVDWDTFMVILLLTDHTHQSMTKRMKVFDSRLLKHVAESKEKLEGPSELFTTVPSRSFFPRGFLWDEGFHLMPIVDWDLDLALEVLKSWFSLIDEDGWIGREQILGAEARSKVPAEFQVQYPHYANPPTLFFIVDSFISKLGALNGTTGGDKTNKESLGAKRNSVHLRSPELGLQYLQELYPKLKKHYYWFRKTQFGDLKSYDRDGSMKEAYRWRGRSERHILTSGLDDYPRPQPPHPGELHVDLISWMGMMTKSLKNIASLLKYDDHVEELTTIETAILRNIDDLHWSEKEKCYCNATIDDFEENKLVCHKGYISLFPFLTGLIDPESKKLGHILKLLGDENELWSEYGIRSLSKSDPFYGTNENYWRGPIWIT